MQRWTDGKSWSSSRICGVFLIYYEMEGRLRRARTIAMPIRDTRTTPVPQQNSGKSQEEGEDTVGGYGGKVNGLIKKTFSAHTSDGKHFHLVSYYSQQHLSLHELQRPTADPRLHHIAPRVDKYQNPAPSLSSSTQQRERVKPGLDTRPPDSDSLMSGPSELRSITPELLHQSLKHGPSLSSPVVTPPTPIETPFKPEIWCQYISPYLDSLACLDKSITRPHELLPCGTYQRSTSPFLRSSFSSSALRLSPQDSQSKSLEATRVPTVVHALKSQSTSKNAYLAPITDLILATRGHKTGINRVRSKSLGSGVRGVNNDFTIKKRTSWAEDQRVIAALDREFEF